MRLLLATLLAVIGSSGCGGLMAFPPTPTPTPVQRQVLIRTNLPTPPSPATATPAPPPAAASPTPLLTPVPTAPALPLPVPEEAGEFVTSTEPRAHYYYHWTDRRWRTVASRVWFKSVDDLLAWYPDRVPAP